MLLELNIHNIVLISKANIRFGDGLCVMTGETGAGKSIMLDALGLILGNRADTGLIRRGETQAQVSAIFSESKEPALKNALDELGIEVEGELIIRRSISTDGKGKCFINDQAVSAQALKQIAPYLVEIHGQHDQRGLMDSGTHRAMLDAFGKHDALLAEVGEAYTAWSAARESEQKALEEIAQAKREEEYLKHIAADLGALRPEAGEEEALSDRRGIMMQSEKLFSVLNDALGELMSHGGASATLRSVQRTLMRSALTQTKEFEPIVEMLDKASELAGEAEEELEAIGKRAEYDPKVLEEMEERLFAIRAAARKYKVSADELPVVLSAAEDALKKLKHNEEHAKKAAKLVAETKAVYAKAAEKLSDARKKSIAKLEKNVMMELAPLKMEHTHFAIAQTQLDEAHWGRAGADAIAMQVATNVSKGEAASFAPLHKIASGGELSRLMLALKVALADVHSAPTMIFDEIDTGTGGAVADAIGKRLATLGASAQVLVVTHLPQVAARGSQHLLVSKATMKKQVETSIVELDAEARREELARMLAGETITPEARKAADKLLEHAA